MSGELCSGFCGFCGRCDADYAVRCETPGCDQAVALPETDVYCQDCRQQHARVIGRITPDAPWGEKEKAS
jgi:hypothetical protein